MKGDRLHSIELEIKQKSRGPIWVEG
jgi:hypothetical protein